VPQNVTGLTDVIANPIYATSVGLLLYGHQQNCLHGGGTPLLAGAGMKGVWGRMKTWFQGNF